MHKNDASGIRSADLEPQGDLILRHHLRLLARADPQLSPDALAPVYEGGARTGAVIHACCNRHAASLRNFMRLHSR